METKHTKGPWKMNDSTTKSPSLLIQSETEDIAMVIFGLRSDNTKKGNTGSTTYANAKLISASPDMLEALLKIDEWINCGNHVADEYVDTVKEAIKKATK